MGLRFAVDAYVNSYHKISNSSRSNNVTLEVASVVSEILIIATSSSI